MFTPGASGIETMAENNNYSLYPNPASAVLAVQFSKPNLVSEWTLFDLLGNELKRKEITDARSTEIPLEGLPDSFYLLRIKEKSGKISYLKFAKK